MVAVEISPYNEFSSQLLDEMVQMADGDGCDRIIYVKDLNGVSG